MSYSINGVGVGKDPSSIARSNEYNAMFEKIGNSSDNIKTIPNFLPSDQCDEIIASLVQAESDEDQWSDRVYDAILAYPIGRMIHNKLEESYQTKVKLVQEPYVIKWSTGQAMGYHVDDLGIEDYHITGLVYLNDDYTGGEISFLTHDITIKPNKGDLIMFPGNFNYAHEVKEILSGERYTVPVWFKFI